MNLQVHRLILTCLAAAAVGWQTADGAAAPPPAGPAWAWNLPVYETALDLATPHGTFREFEQRLDALQDLGVGIIWLLPIFPTGGNPPDKPRSNSAYCVRDYYDVNPRHGTKEEFKHLVAAIPLEHWQWLRPKLDALKPVFMLAEADEPRLHPVFDMTYDWTSQVNFYMIARGTWPASSLDGLLDTERRKFPAGAVRMRHLTNHDMAREQYAWDNRLHLDKSEYEFLEKTPLPAKYKGGDRAFAVLCTTLPNSKPMVWNGQELGILANTPKLQWNDSPYLEFYRKLLHTYRRNPALYQGEFHKIATSKPEAVYAYWRQAGQNRAVVVANLADQPQHVTLELGEFAGHYTEVFTAEDRVLTAQEKLHLESWAYRVYLNGASQPVERSGKP